MRKTVIASASNDLRGLFMDREYIDRKLCSLKQCLSRLESRQFVSDQASDADPAPNEDITREMDAAARICTDLSSHLIYASLRKVPESDEEKFSLLVIADILTEELAEKMQKYILSAETAGGPTDQGDQQVWPACLRRAVSVFWEYTRQVERTVG